MRSVLVGGPGPQRSEGTLIHNKILSMGPDGGRGADSEREMEIHSSTERQKDTLMKRRMDK